MALTPEDLKAIRKVVDESLEDVRLDLKKMKGDLQLLATLNQLDEIKKDGRLRVLYSQKEDREEA